MGKLTCYFLSLAMIFLAGCQSGSGNKNEIDENQREFILTKVNDFQGLIKLYREKLNRKEDKKTRYSLAKYYHLAMDYESSRHYLLPLLADSPDEDTLLLEGKNLLEQGHIAEGIESVKGALDKNPKSGEALNTQGVLLAQQGNYHAAKASFDEARSYYVDEDKVINNLAMLAIMQEDYPTARDYLVPLYSRGYSSENLLHNLVFVLVKMRDFTGAEAVLNREKSVEVSDGLLESLSRIKPHSQQQLQQRGVVKNQNSSMKNDMDYQRSTQSISLSEEHKNEIVAVRTGQHKKYFRMTMESAERITFKKLMCDDMNQRVYELSNVTVSDEILKIGNSLVVSGVVDSISLTHNDKSTVLVKFSLKRNIEKMNVFHISAEKTAPEKLVFDIHYG